MTVNNVKFNDIRPRKPVFNSSFVNQNKLNKSRSLLKKSVISCNLKANNIELAKALADTETELSELRKENTRLLRENYDITHVGQFRGYNCENFMAKFYELTDITVTIFNEVCKLSDSLLQLQNHAFITGENSNNVTVPEETKLISPFAPRDKIQRSPIQLSIVNETLPNTTATILASQVNKVKEQLSHSIHNLSVNPESYSIINKSFKRKIDVFKPDNDQYSSRVKPKNSLFNSSFLESDTSLKRKMHNLDKSIIENEVFKEKDRVFNTKKKVPKSSPEKKRTKKTTKKHNKLKLKTPANKEEHRKKVEKDAFYLSQNETINCTIVAPTYNEFKKSQPKTKSETNTEKLLNIEVDAKTDKSAGQMKTNNNTDDTNTIVKISDINKPNLNNDIVEDISITVNSKKLLASDIEEVPTVNKVLKRITKSKVNPKAKKTSKHTKISVESPEHEVKNKENINVMHTVELHQNFQDVVSTEDNIASQSTKRKRTAVNYCLSPEKKRKRKNAV